MGDAPMEEDPSKRPKGLNTLLDSNSLQCDFYAAQGANWALGKAQVHGISYQGGPFSYQAINLETGTATMMGSAGVTGSPTGEMEVRVTPTNGGLTFTGFTGGADLVIVTVYAMADSSGNYRAVMSRHGSMLQHETAQFYGACNTILTNP